MTQYNLAMNASSEIHKNETALRVNILEFNSDAAGVLMFQMVLLKSLGRQTVEAEIGPGHKVNLSAPPCFQNHTV